LFHLLRLHPTPSAAPRTRRLARLAGAVALGALALGAAGCGGGSQAEGAKPTLRLGYFPNLTHAVGLVGVANGSVAKALAPTADLEVTAFSAGPQLIEALLAGEVDIAYVGPSPAVNGYVKSRGVALRVIAGASSGGALFVVRPSAGISGPADLAGKRIATPQRGGTQDVALRFMVRGAGLQTSDEGGNVQIVPMAPADILTAFQRGDIDGAFMAEPWVTRLVQEAGAAVWFDERTRWPEGRFATTHVVVATPFLERHRDLVKAFLRAHVDATAFVSSSPVAARTMANQEIARITTAAIPEPVLVSAFGHIDFTYDPLAATVAVMADHAFQLGFLGTTPPDLRGYYALDPLNEVLRERGLPAVGEAGGTQ
jgi:NitT/TauT family transport system substrate-binding protein